MFHGHQKYYAARVDIFNACFVMVEIKYVNIDMYFKLSFLPSPNLWLLDRWGQRRLITKLFKINIQAIPEREEIGSLDEEEEG